MILAKVMIFVLIDWMYVLVYNWRHIKTTENNKWKGNASCLPLVTGFSSKLVFNMAEHPLYLDRTWTRDHSILYIKVLLNPFQDFTLNFFFKIFFLIYLLYIQGSLIDIL